MNSSKLTQGNVYTTMLKFAAPFLLAQLLQALYGAVDLMVVGRFATTADVSGVTIGSQVIMMVTQLIVGLTMGITVLMGQYYGAKKEKDLVHLLGTGILLFFVLGTFLTVVIAFGAPFITSVMNTPAEAVYQVREYLLYCSVGILFMTGYQVVCGILRGLGDSKTPLFFIAIACMINIVLDIFLVKYVGLGAKGAATATTAAQGFSFLFSILYLKKKGIGFPFSRKEIRISRPHLLRLFQIGSPIAFQNVLISISFLVITIIINYMGLVASASVGVVEKLMEFLFLPPIALNAAVSVIVAQNYGAKEYKRTRQCLAGGMVFSFLFGIAVCLYCQFYGYTLTQIFTTDTQVIQTAASYLKSYSIDCVILGFVFCMNGYFNGYGRSMITMAHNTVTTLCVRMPLAFFFSRVPGASLYLIGFATPISTVFSLIICTIYLRHLNRQIDRL